MKSLALMPFGSDFDDVFGTMQQACRQCAEQPGGTPTAGNNGDAGAIACERIDEEMGAAFDIVDTLIRRIRGADFCIADLTGHNQNVMWELGFAMALEKPVILITQDREAIGFDLRNVKNIQYSRTSLRETLEKPLVHEIKNLAGTICHVPTLSSYARSLAMSSGSPTYFLDSEYKIHYMNEAAAAIFTTSSSAGGSKAWAGTTLREFMNTFSRRLENLPAVEKNLQLQNEEIFILQEEKRESAICPYNIERIVLKTHAYGKLELQKTGVAVRDPATDSISGWVVSFNVIKAHEPEKYEKFHEKHRSLVEGMLLPRERPGGFASEPLPRSHHTAPKWPDSVEIRQWIVNGCHDPRLLLADDYAQKQACFDFCASVMKNDPRYGLESVAYLDEWFFDYHNAEYIEMRTPTSNEFVGVFRIHMRTDLSKYTGLEDWVSQCAGDGQEFCDVGAYLNPSISGKTRSKCLATMLGHAARIAELHNQVHLYAQVPSQLFRRFEKFLFRRAGMNFPCPGWRQPSWTPVALKCIAYSGEGSSVDWPAPERIDNDFIAAAREAYQNRFRDEVLF